MQVSIQNRLEVFPGPNGGIIHIPGSEPVGSSTAQVKFVEGKAWGIVEAMRLNGRLGHPVISLNTALEVVPGSSVVRIQNGAGQKGVAMKFFVLPSGPPPPSDCNVEGCTVDDWYQVMADNADGALEEETAAPNLDQICSMFTFRYQNSELF